jgi:hypothetical protein
MTVLEDEGAVEVIPAKVDLIGFFDDPFCQSQRNRFCEERVAVILTMEGDTWIFQDLEDDPSPLR